MSFATGMIPSIPSPLALQTGTFSRGQITDQTGETIRQAMPFLRDPESLAKILEKSPGLNNDQDDNVHGLIDELKDKDKLVISKPRTKR